MSLILSGLLFRINDKQHCLVLNLFAGGGGFVPREGGEGGEGFERDFEAELRCKGPSPPALF